MQVPQAWAAAPNASAVVIGDASSPMTLRTLGVVLMSTLVAEVPFRVVITDASRGRDRSTSQLITSV